MAEETPGRRVAGVRIHRAESRRPVSQEKAEQTHSHSLRNTGLVQQPPRSLLFISSSRRLVHPTSPPPSSSTALFSRLPTKRAPSKCRWPQETLSPSSTVRPFLFLSSPIFLADAHSRSPLYPLTRSAVDDVDLIRRSRFIHMQMRPPAHRPPRLQPLRPSLLLRLSPHAAASVAVAEVQAEEVEEGTTRGAAAEMPVPERATAQMPLLETMLTAKARSDVRLSPPDPCDRALIRVPVSASYLPR